MDVATWLQELGLGQFAPAFEANDIDAQTLRRLTKDDLAQIGVSSVGHRRKLLEAIAALDDVSQPLAHTLPGPPDAEHRQLSVLNCDMVGSTALSERLHPEDMREVIRAFHKACTQVVADYDGYVANFIGDCVLAYFGWPRAHEDDAERAVRAGRALVEAARKLRTPSGEALAVRVGIASGTVVVGDLIREGPAREQSAVGPVPQCAAQLQALAAPGQVAIDALTCRLLGPAFETQALPGSDAAAYAVAGERAAESRFEAHRGPQPAPLVGRDQELALLLERWAQAKGGEGAVVLVAGEAGIGKSRLVRALLDATAREPQERVHWQCSPYHGGSALWPVIQRLGRAVGAGEPGSADAALDKLETLAGRRSEATALYATLLGLNGSQRYGPLEMTPQMLRERTLELLVEQLLEMAAQRPLLLVVEDAHWIDPTTLELLERCLERIDAARMLLLITSRPDQTPKLATHPGVTQLSLNRLSRAGARAIAARLGGDALQAETLATIVAQADGVPLFVEELTKAMLETDAAAIPASLHGSLMARLDCIPDAKEVAQIAACIGREFDPALVQAVAERPEAVAAAIDRLAAAELVFKRGSKYAFKHALVQEAAGESLLRSKRQRIHARILQALEEGPASTAPELLAHHAQGARLADKAIDYWKAAGDAALSQSAYAEAASCFGKAIELIGAQADRVDRRGQELELQLQLQLGQAYRGSHGYGAASTGDTFERAYELIQAGAGDARHRLSTQYGLWAAYVNRGEVTKALQQGIEALADAKAGGQPETLLGTHRIVGTSYVLLGNFAKACDHLEQTMQLLPSAKRSEFAPRFGSDPAATCFGWLAWMRQIQGLVEQSNELAGRARSIVGSLSQVDNRALLHFLFAVRAALVRDHAAVAADVDILSDLAAGHRLRMHKGYVDCLRGWMASSSGRPDEAVAAYQTGIAEITAVGSLLYVPFFSAGLAYALAADGRHDEASHTAERAIAHCEQSAQGWCDAELWRLRGEVTLQDPECQPAAAVRCFEHALALARRRGAKLWELRSAVSLARMWAVQGDRVGAMELLAPTCAWFPAGLQTADLTQARALLTELESVV